MNNGFPLDWQTLPLKDCISAIIDYRGKSPHKTTSGIPLITAKIVKNGRVEKPEEFIAEEDFNDWMRRGLPEAGDVVMTTEAPLGEIAQLDGRKVALAQRLIALRGKPGFLDNTFLKFLMQSQFVQEQLRARSTGTTVLGIRQSELRNVSLVVPPFEEQRAIARILGTLEEKIELNRRMNETLEAMDRALFKFWFVDTTKNGLPEGWRMSTLGAHVDVTKGLSYKGSGLAKEGMPLHNLNAIYEGGSYKYEGVKFYTGDYKERHICHPGDVIVANTEQGFEYLLIGYPAIVPKRFGKIGLFTHHIYRICAKPTSPLTNHFIYLQLMNPAFRDQVISFTNGTTVNALAREGLERPEFALPPPEMVQVFERTVAPMFERQEENVEETLTLTTLLDTLLPRLISGAVRVRYLMKEFD